MIHEPDIAIIGAGAAGIGAARRLAASSFTVLVLEALPRIGGRAWTQRDAGVPLDLGCGWLHSADRNPLTRIAEESGYAVDRRMPAWGTQYLNLGFPAEEHEAARGAFARWSERLVTAPPDSDRALDLVEQRNSWRAYLQAMSGFVSGDELGRISVQDYVTYDRASTGNNWRVLEGLGTVISNSFPRETTLALSTPVKAIALHGGRVAIRTTAGTVYARTAIITASTNVLAGNMIALPSALEPWRDAAHRLPLGHNEKLFLKIVGNNPFAPESHVLGDPHDSATGAFYIRPFGWPVIECFFGGAGARLAAAEGAQAAFARAIDQLARLFGTDVRRNLRPVSASDWTGTLTIGGAYSHALPGEAAARRRLAQPFDDRLFFAGEATSLEDFSTAHGAYLSGVRAAEEVIATLKPSRINA